MPSEVTQTPRSCPWPALQAHTQPLDLHPAPCASLGRTLQLQQALALHAPLVIFAQQEVQLKPSVLLVPTVLLECLWPLHVKQGHIQLPQEPALQQPAPPAQPVLLAST